MGEYPGLTTKGLCRKEAIEGSKDGDMVPGAEETTEFATEEEESLEEVANNSNMAAALLLVDCPESCSLRREEKASSRSGENE